MTIVRLLILLVMGFFASDAFAASFDCGKAAGPVEKLICGDQDVSRLDTQLQGTYQTALGAVDASSKDRLVKEQRNWIRYTRNICQDEACLGDAYKARIAVLGRNEKYLVDKASCDIPDGKSCRSVVVYRDPEARIDSFNKSLVEQKISGKIIGCARLVDLPVGTASGNHSFGGYCTLENDTSRSDVKICNDDMVGHFSMQKVATKNEPDKALVDFVNTECFGG